jgi:phosphoribosylamine---glycine ligase
MNIVLIGSGGREHAIASKLATSPLCNELFILPGNPGTATIGTNVIVDVTHFEEVKAFCVERQVSMVVVGPEAPLVDGITDSFRADPRTQMISIIGPDAYAAQLEGSKAFAKKFMQKYDIPTAAYLEVNGNNLDKGYAFLESLPPPYVLKADGLAAGKGVLIIDNIDEAKAELQSMLGGKFGSASSTVVIEQFLSGIEFSVFAVTDGKSAVVLPEAKDYKRVGNGDVGLNTGGMGAVSPVPFCDEVMWQKVHQRIIKPTIDGIASEGMDYKGFVFFGLINVGGDPYVIEYNCRMGDPETEVVMPRITSDFVDLLYKVSKGQASECEITVDPRSAVTVMMVSGGYPGSFDKGKAITLVASNDAKIYHAGTALKDGQLVSNGGRVLAVTHLDDDFRVAAQKSIALADQIHFEGKYYRTDIGQDL